VAVAITLAAVAVLVLGVGTEPFAHVARAAAGRL